MDILDKGFSNSGLGPQGGHAADSRGSPCIPQEKEKKEKTALILVLITVIIELGFLQECIIA